MTRIGAKIQQHGLQVHTANLPYTKIRVTESMQLTINGEAKELDDGMTLGGLLEDLEINRQQVAVEVNAVLVPRESHDGHELNAGDQVEIVTLVGGG